MEQQGYEEDLLRRWFQQDAEGPAKHLTETDICDIAEVLTRSSKDAWSRIPRIYSILRKIGQLDAIDAFIDDGFTDVSFPFSGTTLPEALRDHSARLNFLELQHLVYDTEALDLERHARHGHFSDPKDVPLKKVGELGKGGFGYVDRVVSTISHKEYARKLISRGRTFRKDKQVLRAFTKELSNLKGLSHRHLVKLAGSYTDRKFVAIIMLPVADKNLQTFLENTDLDDTSRSFLRPFFGCLTSALMYLHDNRIRHKDIKPSNVLIKHDQVYLTDFGTSLDWSGCDNSTTVTAPPTTPRYCAPEVMAFAARNTSSDIWSLGCVFLEMWTVLKRFTLDGLKAHMSENGTQVKEYHHNLEAIASWIQMLENATGPLCDLAPSKWVQNMLQHEPRSRWNCHVLANHIHEASIDPSSEYAFKGLCCLEPDDDTTDETASSDGHIEAESLTHSLPTLEQRDSGQIVESAASHESQIESLVDNESASPADPSLLAHYNAPVPRILVNDLSVPPGASVEIESDSLARELYDFSAPAKATDDFEKAYPGHNDIKYSAPVTEFSGSDDETLEGEMTDIVSPLATPIDEILSLFKFSCRLCSSCLKVAEDTVRLPCHHWIHNSCRGQGYRLTDATCLYCNKANTKPPSQANRHFREFNDWARKHNEAHDRLRSAEKEKAVDEIFEGFKSPTLAAPIASDPTVTAHKTDGIEALATAYDIVSGLTTEFRKTTTRPTTEVRRTTTRPTTEVRRTASRPPTEVRKTRSRPTTEGRKAILRPTTEVRKTVPRPETLSPVHSSQSVTHSADSGTEKPRTRKKRTVRPISASDPDLTSQEHGLPKATGSKKPEPRSEGTDNKATSKSGRSKFPTMHELFGAYRPKKRTESQNKAPPIKRDASRQWTKRDAARQWAKRQYTQVDSESSGDEAAPYYLASRARTEDDIRRKAEDRRAYEDNRYAGATQPPEPVRRSEARRRPVALTDEDPPLPRPKSAEPPATKTPAVNRSSYLAHRTVERVPGSEREYESYSSGDNERGRAPSTYYRRYGPEDVRWAPRSTSADDRVDSEPKVYSRRYGPEDVRWAPRASDGGGRKEFVSKPTLGRTATYVY